MVVVALAVGACAAKDPSSNAASGKGNKAQTAEKKPKQPWWKLSQYSREPKEKPWVYGDIRPGKGVASGDEHGFVLMRRGEGLSSDPRKPAKVKR
ncbi:MAG: hypothetical protein F4027_17755 [Rhodospirillaceae bacterium]|nr:hypothetical protein [Rhodospirillaceae bacterium]